MASRSVRKSVEPVVEQQLLRIGEVAELTGVTTRTLRYWEELRLIVPAGYSTRGERRYASADVARVTRIRNLQELLGFSLAEVRAVLETEDVGVLDRVRSTFGDDKLTSSQRRELLEEGIAANDQLLDRLDATLSRVQAFREERVAAGGRLRAKRNELDGAATGSAMGHRTPTASSPASPRSSTSSALGGGIRAR